MTDKQRSYDRTTEEQTSDDRCLTKISSWRTAWRSLLTKFFPDEKFLLYSTQYLNFKCPEPHLETEANIQKSLTPFVDPGFLNLSKLKNKTWGCYFLIDINSLAETVFQAHFGDFSHFLWGPPFIPNLNECSFQKNVQLTTIRQNASKMAEIAPWQDIPPLLTHAMKTSRSTFLMTCGAQHTLCGDIFHLFSKLALKICTKVSSL